MIAELAIVLAGLAAPASNGDNHLTPFGDKSILIYAPGESTSVWARCTSEHNIQVGYTPSNGDGVVRYVELWVNGSLVSHIDVNAQPQVVDGHQWWPVGELSDSAAPNAVVKYYVGTTLSYKFREPVCGSDEPPVASLPTVTTQPAAVTTSIAEPTTSTTFRDEVLIIVERSARDGTTSESLVPLPTYLPKAVLDLPSTTAYDASGPMSAQIAPSHMVPMAVTGWADWLWAAATLAAIAVMLGLGFVGTSPLLRAYSRWHHR